MEKCTTESILRKHSSRIQPGSIFVHWLLTILIFLIAIATFSEYPRIQTSLWLVALIVTIIALIRWWHYWQEKRNIYNSLCNQSLMYERSIAYLEEEKAGIDTTDTRAIRKIDEKLDAYQTNLEQVRTLLKSFA